jgi:hypothetical protein
MTNKYEKKGNTNGCCDNFFGTPKKIEPFFKLLKNTEHA